MGALGADRVMAEELLASGGTFATLPPLSLDSDALLDAYVSGELARALPEGRSGEGQADGIALEAQSVYDENLTASERGLYDAILVHAQGLCAGTEQFTELTFSAAETLGDGAVMMRPST